MWMPQQIPLLGDELRELGLQIDPDAFDDLTGFPMGAIVWLGGCSATFVSEDGLILTNHHCVYGALQYNSTPERDLMHDGFLARTRSEEILASPTARAYVTTDIEDVTSEILADLGPEVSDRERAEIVDERCKQMVKECEEPGDVRCWVRSFFEGETYIRITAMILKDVRLVYAPPQGVGNFGGEVDNWTWPRHVGDFGFFRVYIGPDGNPAEYAPDNVPYHPEHHLKISTRDLDPGDLVLLAGYPGRTSRLVSADEMRQAQEWRMPTAVQYRTELSDILRAQGEDDRAVQIANASRIRSLDNYKKKETGVLEAFRHDNLLAHKLDTEKKLEEYVSSDPDKAAEYDRVRKEFRKVLADERSTRERDLVFAWLNTASPLLSQANTLYRLSLERPKPDDDRHEGYQERDWPNIEARIRRTQRVIDVGSDHAGLRWILGKAASLPDDQRIEALDIALAATEAADTEAQIEALLDQLYVHTRLTDLDTRLAMFDESTDELLDRDDAFLELAAALRPLGKEIEGRKLMHEGARLRLRPRLIAMQRDMLGGKLAPDANRTLRVGFGVVKGYLARDAVFYRPQTTVRGVLEKDTGVSPFNSPPRLLQMARAERFGTYADDDLHSLPVGFLSTVSVTNGSSGSSALNAWGEIIGLAFDMNWEGVAADWVVNEDVVRTIHVDSRYMLWIMDAVDGAHNLLREMGLPVQFPETTGAAATGTGP
jgi:hypothetical protein